MASQSEGVAAVDALESKLAPTPLIDKRELRRALGQFATGVAVITAQRGGEPVGLTVNSFSSVSLDPPLILWSIDRGSRSFGAFVGDESSEYFAVNILGENQIAAAQVFSCKDEKKFADISWFYDEFGCPLLDGAATQFCCIRTSVVQAGDHAIIIGRILTFNNTETGGLVFSQGRYAVARDHPSLTKSVASSVTVDGQLPLLSLIAKVHYLEDRDIERHRRAQGLSLISSKLLAGLYGRSERSVEELASEMVLDPQACRDAIPKLIEDGLVTAGFDARLRLTKAGTEKRQKVIEGVAAYQANQLRDIPPEDVQTVRNLLLRILDVPNG